MRGRRWVIAAVGLAVLAAVIWAARGRRDPAPAAGAQRAAQGDARSRPVPVVAAVVQRRDVPVSLEGLGTVTAFQTVTVRAQVDGRLEAVLFREGQPVRRGEVIARIDPRPFEIQLRQARGALARDRAQLENARLNVKRYEELAAEKLIAPQQLDDQRAAVRQLEGALAMDDAAVATAQLNLDYSRITSPIDGVAGVRLVDPGNLVRASDPNGLVVVTQLDPVAVLFTLPQDELPRVARELAQGKVAVEAYAREGATLLGRGELVAVDNQINASTATVRLKAVMPNATRQLWPNQFVKARLLLAPTRGALVVPATAVQRGPSGTFAFVIGADETVAPRPLEVAATLGEVAIVAKGLAEGERVVAEGGAQLRPGSKVAPREPGAGGRAPQAAGPDARPAGPEARAGGEARPAGQEAHR